MYDELSRLIEGRASPELTQAILTLDVTLSRAGFNMHREELDYLLTGESSVDGAEILLNVASILRTAADTVLFMFEVEVDGEIPWPMLISLVSALAEFAPSDNYDAIDAIIKDTTAADETLCDILELLTEFSAEDYLPYIVTVGEKLITTVEEKIEEFRQCQNETDDVSSETAQRIARYRNEVPNAFISELDQAGVPPGVDMESMYNQFTEQLLELSVEDAVKGLVCMAVHSSVSTEGIGDETSFFIEDLYPDLESNQKANICLRKELAALESLLRQDK